MARHKVQTVPFSEHTRGGAKVIRKAFNNMSLEDLAKYQIYMEKQQKPPVIPEDLFKNIVGFEDIKQMLVMALKADKPVHILLVGPPTSAKTTFLLELERLGSSRYALGNTTRDAGLTRFLLENKPAILIVDEIDKASSGAVNILHSLMETGIVTELKTGRTETMFLKTKVFAACNSIDRISEALLSRFQPLFLEPYDNKQFLEVVSKVLVNNEGANQEVADYIGKILVEKYPFADVRTAIRIARMAGTKEQVDQVVSTMLKYRG